MIARGALLLLVFVAALAVANRWQKARLARRPPAPPIEVARRCPACGAYAVGPCSTPGCQVR